VWIARWARVAVPVPPERKSSSAPASHEHAWYIHTITQDRNRWQFKDRNRSQFNFPSDPVPPDWTPFRPAAPDPVLPPGSSAGRDGRLGRRRSASASPTFRPRPPRERFVDRGVVVDRLLRLLRRRTRRRELGELVVQVGQRFDGAHFRGCPARAAKPGHQPSR
jgi:hypothetical protein